LVVAVVWFAVAAWRQRQAKQRARIGYTLYAMVSVLYVAFMVHWDAIF
jgi:hypothetical protein